MLTFTQAIILGLVQGFTELFPISSLGHSVLLPMLLGWKLDQSAPFFVVFLVATHLATALVLIGFYFRDWIRIAQGFLRSLIYRRVHGDVYAKLAWLLIAATIPAGLLGFLFQNKLSALFASPHIVAVFLFANGLMLLVIERMKKRPSTSLQTAGGLALDTNISRLTGFQALRAGTMQALALFPGFSRTGASIGGGLLSGLDHASAARFSFLLATPIILAAAVLKLPVLFTATHSYPTQQIVAGMLAAAFAALVSVLFLTRYFRTRSLLPFAYYCMLAGASSIIFFLFS
ncbi:MAG: undecaprenyl-diphosphate phosphatase [Parcubacteria group bacterium]|jgi:undecaprenyl-diphosphatase|nr:undecaprenyl-diphosphate phosphatase [Parcubacteria group bacterium]